VGRDWISQAKYWQGSAGLANLYSVLRTSWARRGDRGGIGPDLLDTVEDILVRLDEAETPQDMNLPGYRLHPLKGD
jgi:hypothetical protein